MSESLAVDVAVVFLATGVIWIGSEWLEGSSAKLAAHYDLPPVVQGGIVAAVGSSFPELASVVVAALVGSFGLGVGAIVGSAIFNVLAIPALAVVLGNGRIVSSRTLVHKETLFYVLAILVLFLTFALAIVYNPTGGDSGQLTRLLVLFPLAVYAFYLFLQWQDTTDYGGRTEPVQVEPRRQWLLLVVGLVVILVGVERLVDAVLALGAAVGTPDFLWGITVVAAATSLPDTLVSVQAARGDHDVASIANVIGSNTFDLLVIIPVGVLIVGSAPIEFGMTAPMMACLLVATALLFVLLRTDLVLSRREAYLLLVAYGLFVAWVLAETLALVNVLPGAGA